MKRRGFTLIELLAVIIILAVIALIATPIVLNVVENAKESARKSSVNGYADSIKMAIYDYQFENNGQYPIMNKEWVESNAITKGEKVSCEEVYFSTTFDVVLHKCRVGSNTKQYCEASGKVYDCENEEYKNIYNNLDKTETNDKNKSKANQPVLVDKLIPIIYENDTWKVADTTKKWYDYDNKEWANAVIFENGITKNVGDTLNIDTEVAQMYVWIPRYEYQIPEASIGIMETPNAIHINFISKDVTTATTGYHLHPGFTFDGVNQAGIWVGKFETTGETKETQTRFNCVDESCTQKVTIKPSYIIAKGNVSNLFYASRSIANQYSLNNVDTHMTKYTEWTAVSYLTNSIYGRCSDATHCTEVTINNDSTHHTGNAANEGITSSNAGISNAYNTTQGMVSSTTGNITGVYDMSGGVWEYTMGVLLDADGNPRSGYTSTSNSGFNGMYQDGVKKTDGLAFPNEKYYDTFVSNATSTRNYSTITHVNGVASDYRGIVKELLATPYTTTTNWYGDYAYSIYASEPWFILGGDDSIHTYAGVFSTTHSSGGVDSNVGSRVVLLVNQ